MTTVHQLSKTKKLIDLNGPLANFEATFKVQTKNGEPFDLLVVDQTTLDNNPDLPYQKAQGEISGTVTENKGVFQNYFLVLKADPPCECQVEIILREIPRAEVKAPPPVPQKEDKSKIVQVNKKFEKKLNWKKILLFLGLTVACCVGIYFYVTRSDSVPSSPSPKPKSSSPHSPHSPRVEKGGEPQRAPTFIRQPLKAQTNTSQQRSSFIPPKPILPPKSSLGATLKIPSRSASSPRLPPGSPKLSFNENILARLKNLNIE